MAVAAKVQAPKHLTDRRRLVRRPLRLNAPLGDHGAGLVIHDLSASGLLIETPEDLTAGETLLIDLPERGPTAATVVWNSGRFFGCAFELSIPVATVSAALLQSPILTADVRQPAAAEEMLESHLDEDEAELQVDDRFSLRTRGLVLMGLAGVSWGTLGALTWWFV